MYSVWRKLFFNFVVFDWFKCFSSSLNFFQFNENDFLYKVWKTFFFQHYYPTSTRDPIPNLNLNFNSWLGIRLDTWSQHRTQLSPPTIHMIELLTLFSKTWLMISIWKKTPNLDSNPSTPFQDLTHDHDLEKDSKV